MLKEFKEFISRGNVIDLAVGVVIGAAFSAIVNSFVKDILSPIIGLLGSTNFDNQKLVLKHTADKDVVLNYGAFLTAVVNFILVALGLFLFVKAVNKVYRKPAAAPPPPSKEEALLTEIRDILKEGREPGPVA